MKKGLKVLISIVTIIIIFFVTINIIPAPKNVAANPFITEKTMLASHRGGKILNPENTLKAFEEAVVIYQSDILEMDLCLTKDEELVIIHNLYINNNCDVEEVKKTTEKQYVNDYTYDELLAFNFGYKFVDQAGNTPYKDITGALEIKKHKLNILKIEELFARFYESNPDLLYIIEIKDADSLGYQASDKLANLLLNVYPKLQNRVVIGTFHNEIESYIKEEYPSLLRGASTKVATNFIVTEMLNVNLFDKGTFACLQIPLSIDIKSLNLNLVRKDVIKRAHRRNCAVQYWTVNEKADMEKLITFGCDAIMTDNPKLLLEVLTENGLKS